MNEVGDYPETVQQSLGKILGKMIFYLCFIIAIIYTIMIIIEFITNFIAIFGTEKTITINVQALGSLTLFVGSVMGIVWGAKASSNFSKAKDLKSKYDYLKEVNKFNK